MPKVKLTFAHSKSTKGTHVFSEVVDDGKTEKPPEAIIVGALYMKRRFFIDGKIPPTIGITIKY